MNLVRQGVKRSGSEDVILTCEYLYAVDLQANKTRFIVAGAKPRI